MISVWLILGRVLSAIGISHFFNNFKLECYFWSLCFQLIWLMSLIILLYMHVIYPKKCFKSMKNISSCVKNKIMDIKRWVSSANICLLIVTLGTDNLCFLAIVNHERNPAAASCEKTQNSCPNVSLRAKAPRRVWGCVNITNHTTRGSIWSHVIIRWGSSMTTVFINDDYVVLCTYRSCRSIRIVGIVAHGFFWKS